MDYNDSTITFSMIVDPQAIVNNTQKVTTIFDDDLVESIEEFAIILNIEARVSSSSVTMATVEIIDDDCKSRHKNLSKER